ncbi:MAG: asparaginase [Firmicutes bacterium]|nr:asparaginase [Bacillota bacterium]
MEKLVEITRGVLSEKTIRGSIVVLDEQGEIERDLGDVHFLTYMRSAAKPLQATPAVESGAVDAFGIDGRELAVMCGSHIGEEEHVAAVLSILRKLGLKEEDLTLGADLSLSRALREQRLAEGIASRKAFNNCSGKHACMLALCRFYGWPTAAYQAPQHPVQQLILSVVAEYAQLPKEDIIVGVDGCGVPVFGMPLSHMAKAYYRLAHPQTLPERRGQAAARITRAMGAYPTMVAGRGRFCSELMRVTQGRIIGKLGADGIYCSAVLNGPALALKVEDGNMEVLPLIMVTALRQLGWLKAEEAAALAHFAAMDNINCQNEKVGEAKAVFSL